MLCPASSSPSRPAQGSRRGLAASGAVTLAGGGGGPAAAGPRMSDGVGGACRDGPVASEGAGLDAGPVSMTARRLAMTSTAPPAAKASSRPRIRTKSGAAVPGHPTSEFRALATSVQLPVADLDRGTRHRTGPSESGTRRCQEIDRSRVARAVQRHVEVGERRARNERVVEGIHGELEEDGVAARDEGRSCRECGGALTSLVHDRARVDQCPTRVQLGEGGSGEDLVDSKDGSHRCEHHISTQVRLDQSNRKRGVDEGVGLCEKRRR